MKKKKRFIKLLACGLCVTMLAGCSSKKTDREAENNVNVKNQDSSITLSGNESEIITQLKAKYADEAAVEYAEPMYNLEKDHIFTYENLPEEYFDYFDESECFAVYYDSNLENLVDVNYESDYDTRILKISPNLVFSYDDEQGSTVDDGTWGSRSKFWLVQKIDLETGKKLDKPIVTVFTIARELNTSTLEQGVSENGSYSLKWSEVDGADYYEVYRYDEGMDFALLEVTTEKTGCEYEEFETAIWHEQRFEEKYGGTEVDVDEIWQMNVMLDTIYSYFVVAKTNDGKQSGMSNECKVRDIANQVPYMVSDDFKEVYEGDTVLALPAYVDVQMVDGSVGQFLIQYTGAQATLLNDGRIMIAPSIKNLPISMQYIEFKGMDFDSFMAESSKLKDRENELTTKSVTTNREVNVPFVPENDYRTPDNNNQPQTPETENSGQIQNLENEKNEPVQKPENDSNFDIPEEVLETVYANTSLSEWIALNMLAHNEEISLADFPESSDTDYLLDAILEAYTQNPLCGIMSKLDYDYSTDSLLVGYVLSKEETVEMQKTSLKKAEEIAADIIKESMSDYEKEEAINRYICDNAEYNNKIMEYINNDGTISEDAVWEYANSFTPYGILVENMGVCESYAEAFKLIADKAGLEVILETGRLDGVNHEWNRVKIENQWYTLDVTNNDCEYLPNCYFNLSDEVAGIILQEDGDALMDKFIPNYTASDMSNEYYTKNNLYTENASEAVSLLVDMLMENEMAAVRMNLNYGEDTVDNIVKEVVNEVQLTAGKYYYNAGVISIVKK